MDRMRAARRSRMADIARASGFSLATVDRALNGRGTVRRQTFDLVLKTAGELGYVALPPAREAASRFHFDVILPGGSNSFLRSLTDEFAAAAQARRADLAVAMHRIEDFKPDVLAAELARIDDSDGVAVIAPDHPAVREELRGLAARGVPVVTLVTDVANIDRIGYVGIDNRAAGRLAGQLLGRLLGGRTGAVILMLGSRSYRGLEEREIGFRDVLAEDCPGLEIIDVRDVHDDLERARSETLRLLDSRPDVVGLYNAAAGNRGVAAALLEAQRRPKIVFVAHELTEHSRKYLISGLIDVVIDQDPRREAAEVLRLLHARASGAPFSAPPPLRMTPIFRENLP